MTDHPPTGSVAEPVRRRADEPDKALVTELRIHGVGGAGPSDILNRSDVVAEDGDRIAGFYRTTEEAPPVRRIAYSWGGLTSRRASRAFWTLLLPFSLINVAGWMLEPTKKERGPDERTPNGVEKLIARFFAWACGLIGVTSARLRRAQRWLIHVVGLTVTILYVQWVAMLTVNVVAYQCGSNATCYRSRSWLAFFENPIFAGHPGRRIVLGAAVPIALLLLFVMLSRRTRRLYVDFDPATVVPHDTDEGEGPNSAGSTAPSRPAETKPVVEYALDSPAFWQQPGFHNDLARIHFSVALSVSAGVLAYAMNRLGAFFGDETIERSGMLLGVAAVALILIGLGALWRLLFQGGSTGPNYDDEPKLIHWAKWLVPIALMATTLGVMFTFTAADAAIVDTGAADLWGFGWTPLVILGVGMAALLVATLVQLLRWALDEQVDLSQFCVPLLLAPVAIFRTAWSIIAVAIVAMAGNMWQQARTQGSSQYAISRTRCFLGNGGLIILVGLAIGLVPLAFGQSWWVLAAGISLVAATYHWVTTESRTVFRWFGTGAVATVGFLGLVGILAGVGIRLTALLADAGTDVELRTPALLEWMALGAFVATVAAWLAAGLYTVQQWIANAPRWKAEARQRSTHSSRNVGVEVRLRALVAGARSADVLMTVYAMLLFVAAAAGLIHLMINEAFSTWPDAGVPARLNAWVTLATWAEVAYVIVGYLVVRSALRDEGWRRRLGTIWDVASFWPNRYHPFAPPAYAARAVPELADKITRTLEKNPRKAFILSGHSQGSVLAIASAALLEPRHAARVALVTHGSPIGPYYQKYFPSYFSEHHLTAIGRKLGGTELVNDGTWVNLYRPTDPIGGELDLRRSDAEVLSLRAIAESFPDLVHALPDVSVDPCADSAPGYGAPHVQSHSGYDAERCTVRFVEALTDELTNPAPDTRTIRAYGDQTHEYP